MVNGYYSKNNNLLYFYCSHIKWAFLMRKGVITYIFKIFKQRNTYKTKMYFFVSGFLLLLPVFFKNSFFFTNAFVVKGHFLKINNVNDPSKNYWPVGRKYCEDYIKRLNSKNITIQNEAILHESDDEFTSFIKDNNFDYDTETDENTTTYFPKKGKKKQRNFRRKFDFFLHSSLFSFFSFNKNTFSGDHRLRGPLGL